MPLTKRLLIILYYGRQQSLNRRVIACCRAFEKVGDVALRHDDDGTTKLQRVTLERTGHETRTKGRKTLGKGFHPDDIGKAAFKL